MSQSRPNVLILMCDQLKANALGLYGNSDVMTPNLERLAAAGTLFSRHYVTAPMCVPSRAAFWSGMYPHSTGIRHNQVLMPPGAPNFARLLHEAGYGLELFGKDHCFQGADRDLFNSRFELGHRGLVDAEGNSQARDVAELLRDPALNKKATETIPIPYPPEACSTSLIANRTVEFLDEWNESGDDPFCAWVSFPDPHHPLAAPEPYASMYSPDQITMPPVPEGELDDKMERQRVFHHLMEFDKTREADLRKAVAMYYGMISFLDDGIGVILDALDRLDMAEDTIIIFTADHGDYAGEHGMMLKSGTFYDCMTRVPLIVSWPGGAPKGETRDDLVSNIDVMPTVMSLIGLESEKPVHGRLLPGIAGDTPREAVFAEHGAGGPRVLMSDLERYADYTTPLPNLVVRLMHARNAEGRPKMVRTGRWKYVYDPMDPVDELYDLDSDPWELANVATSPEYAAVRSELRDRLLRWAIMTEDRSATPLYSDPVTLTDTRDGGPDFYYEPLEDQ